MPVANVDSSNYGWRTSARPSLLGAIVVTDVFCLSLLRYHYSDGSIAHGHSDLQPIAIVSVRSSDRS
jgi:hypothetical protein